MLFDIKIAGIVIRVKATYHHTWIYMIDYVVDEENPDIFISLTSDDIDKEWDKSPVVVDREDIVGCACYRRRFEKQALYHYIIEEMSAYSIISMHGAVVCDGNSAYLLSAPSGTGKSTRARLFVENHPGSFILNGDKPFIRVEKDKVVACGSPWKGKENEGINSEAPLKAVFLIKRAEKTEIKEITMREAFDYLLAQTYIPSKTENIVKTIQLIRAMEGKVRFFRLSSPATFDSMEEAWRTANNS